MSSCRGRVHSGRSTVYDFLSPSIIHSDVPDSLDCSASCALRCISCGFVGWFSDCCSASVFEYAYLKVSIEFKDKVSWSPADLL